MRSFFIGFVPLLIVEFPAYSAAAGPETKAVVRWTASVDRALFPKLVWPEALPKAGDLPTNWGANASLPSVYLSSQKHLDDLWKFLHRTDQPPRVDFDNYGVVVLVGTSGGEVTLKEKVGRLVVWFALSPPLKDRVAYVVAVFPKATLQKALKSK